MQTIHSIVQKIQSLPRPTIVALSGFGGSGKTSIAQKLGEVLKAPVVGVDSFQQKGVFTAQFSMWNIMEYARLEKEVLEPFLRTQNISFGHADASTGGIDHIVSIKNTGILIVEGVGLFRPELLKYFSYKIWIDMPIEEAIARGKKRDREEYGNPTDEFWDGVWKQNDLECLAAFKPLEIADMVVQNTHTL